MKISHIIILSLLISFGSVACIAFTPTLPAMVGDFGVTNQAGELTIICFLVGYAIGQLLYGPIANRYGSCNAIRIAALLTMLASIGCVLSHVFHSFNGLLIARFLLALGAGGGLTLAVAITNKLCRPEEISQVLSLLTIGFSVPPAIAVFICGYLLNYFDSTSAFYFMVAYGVQMFTLSFFLPEVIVVRDATALSPKALWHNYKKQLTTGVVFGGLLLGIVTSFVLVFADLGPFIAMNMMDTNPKLYGIYNFLPMAGMLGGSFLASGYGKFSSPKKMIRIGFLILTCGGVLLMLSLYKMRSYDLSLFIPMIIIYIGFSFVYGNTVSLTLSNVENKINASALVNFINMSSAAIIVMTVKSFAIHSALILPIVYGILIVMGVFWHTLASYQQKKHQHV